jgi:uncharacterized protein with ATP-grasp and redox domains
MEAIFNKLDKILFEYVDFEKRTGTIVFDCTNDDINDYEFDATFKITSDGVEIIDSKYHQVNNEPVNKKAFLDWIEDNHKGTIKDYML